MGVMAYLGSGIDKNSGDDSDKEATDTWKKFQKPPSNTPAAMGELHKGGKVKKTGVYRLRKNELVLTVQQQKAAGLKKTKKNSTKKRIASKG